LDAVEGNHQRWVSPSKGAASATDCLVHDLSRVKAVQWGVSKEEEPIKALTLQTGKTVKDTGIWLYSSGILGASPHEIVDHETVLEAKCPDTERNLTIKEVAKSETFCLGKTDSGQYALKKDHVYWHQIQGEMYLTHRKFYFLYGLQRM